MKVCLTGSYSYPSVIGGAEKYLFCLASSLKKMGLDVIVIVSTPPTSPYTKTLANGDFVFLKPVFRIGANPITPTLFKAIKKEKPDIVHTNSPTIMADFSLLSCKSLRIPIISTYHGVITESSVPHNVLNLYDAFHNGFTLKNCDHIITTTDRYATILCNMGLSEHRISVVPVGIERKFLEARISEKAREKFEQYASRIDFSPAFIVLFVGRLDSHHKYKGLDELLHAFRLVVDHHPDSLLIVVGDGDRRPFYEMLCRSLRLNRNTIFFGSVSKDLLIALYSLSSLFVLPSTSFSEGFGIVLLEAMSRGCPVITTAYAGGAEAVKTEDAGIVIKTMNPVSL